MGHGLVVYAFGTLGLSMKIAAALAADLHDLTVALDDAEVSLGDALRALAKDTHLSIRSLLGLSMTVIVDDYPATFTVFDEKAEYGDIRSSLLIPLTTLNAAAEPGGNLLFYAAKPGALLDLAADITYALNIALTDLVLDRHLTPPQITGTLRELSTINQAIGVLIDRGHTPDQARHELTRTGTTPGLAASAVLATLRRPGPISRQA